MPSLDQNLREHLKKRKKKKELRQHLDNCQQPYTLKFFILLLEQIPISLGFVEFKR